jgi:N utilization substance protein B
VVEDFFRSFQPVPEGELAPGESENLSFCKRLIAGILEQLEIVDTHIGTSSTRWSVSRMSRVDRNIIRIATYELAFLKDIPPSVSINEAIEIAKRFGAPDSPTFVNGVLDKVASILRPEGRGEASKRVANE